MARPRRYNADYFSHDAGMRDDPKVKALRNKFGATGYAVWCMMLEVLTGSDYFRRDIDDIELEILSADFGIDVDLFSEILRYMVRMRLLQKENEHTYFSQKLYDRLSDVLKKRETERDKANNHKKSTANRKVSVSDTGVSASETIISASETTQSKVKESKEKEKKETIKRFTPPTVEEVEAYVIEKSGTIDPQTFVDHYEATGWMRGKNKIKDWKACVRTWEKSNKEKGITQPYKPSNKPKPTLDPEEALRRTREAVKRDTEQRQARMEEQKRKNEAYFASQAKKEAQ